MRDHSAVPHEHLPNRAAVRVRTDRRGRAPIYHAILALLTLLAAVRFAPAPTTVAAAPTFELLGTGRTHNGEFTALVLAPAGTEQIEWTTNDFASVGQITVARTGAPQLLMFTGDLTLTDPQPAAVYTVKARFNGGALGVTGGATTAYDSAFRQSFNDVDAGSSSPYASA